VLTQPPVAVIEILSPGDRISRYNERLDDRQMPANIWVVDPSTRVGCDSSTPAWIPVPVEDFRIAGTPINCR